MTTQVFLIQAHRDVQQLNVLVEQLRDEDFAVYVNLDRKSDIDPAAIVPAARQVAKRIDVHWGGFSQVLATLNALAQIAAEVADFDKVTFLSGQDFPVLSNVGLKQALSALRGRELLDVVEIGAGLGQWNAAYRYQYPHRYGGSRLQRAACSLANRAMRLAGVTRRMPHGMRAYGGSSWWSLSRPCVLEVLARAKHEPETLRFFHSVASPDEMFFQTLVMNSRFANRVLGKNFRYIRWPAGGALHPAVLVEDDFDAIAASDAHFCRKVDLVASAGLVRRLIEARAWSAAHDHDTVPGALVRTAAGVDPAIQSERAIPILAVGGK